jgi:hypothetical protein
MQRATAQRRGDIELAGLDDAYFVGTALPRRSAVRGSAERGSRIREENRSAIHESRRIPCSPCATAQRRKDLLFKGD